MKKTIIFLMILFSLGFVRNLLSMDPEYDFLKGKKYAVLMVNEIASHARMGPLTGRNTVPIIIKNGEWRIAKALGTPMDSTASFTKGKILEIKRIFVDPEEIEIRVRSLEPMAYGAGKAHHKIHQANLIFKLKRRQKYDEVKAAIEKYVTLYETLDEAKAAKEEASSIEIKIGMTIEEVESLLGTPLKKAVLGKKVLYKYKDWKITFEDGKVSDVDF